MLRTSVRIAAALFCVALTQACRAETTDIRDAGGKRILFVDGDDIRPAPGGKRLLFVDGSDIRPEPGGKRLLFVDGDDIRPEPGGIRLAFIDGDEIRRRPGGKVLLYVKHPDIKTDFHATHRIMSIDGPQLSKPQLVAVLYQLKPELFKLSAEEEAALKKEFADNAAAEEARLAADSLPGKYSLLTYSSTDDSKKAGGSMTIEKKGDYYKLVFKNTKTNETYEGVGIKQKIFGDTELWVAFGPENSMALADYDIDDKGNMTGKWVPAYLYNDAASFGSEKLTSTGKDTFNITEAKAPKTGAAYAGTMAITMNGKDVNGDGKCFNALWTMGEVKVAGIGFKYKNKAVIAGSSAKEYLIIRLKQGNGSLAGDFYSSAGATGYYTFSPDQQ